MKFEDEPLHGSWNVRRVLEYKISCDHCDSPGGVNTTLSEECYVHEYTNYAQ